VGTSLNCSRRPVFSIILAALITIVGSPSSPLRLSIGLLPANSLSLSYPLPAFQEDVFYCLVSMSTLALASVGSVDAIKVDSQTNFASPHSCDNGTNCTE
jgi:hypothetical protein